MSDRKDPVKNTSTARLKLLITVVNRKKAEFYADLLQGFHVNLQFTAFGEGTADEEMMGLLGLTDSSKAVLFSVIREDRVHKALQMLEEKFDTIRDGAGIAFTVPLTSVIGASVFRFLCDNRNKLM